MSNEDKQETETDPRNLDPRDYSLCPPDVVEAINRMGDPLDEWKDNSSGDLLPCPFCGGEALPPGDGVDYIICKGCAITFESFFHKTTEEAATVIKKWNARANT